MKPSDLQDMTPKKIRMALPVKIAKGAEYALVDIIEFCKESNADRFYLIPLKLLLIHFHTNSSRSDRDRVSNAVKVQGLNLLLEERLILKTSQYRLRFAPKLKQALAKEHFPPVAERKKKSSDEPKSMTATSSG